MLPLGPTLRRPRFLRFSLPHRSLHLLYLPALHSAQLRPQPTALYNAERVRTHDYTTATMALNAASHNVAGEKTGPVTVAPPSVSDESKKELLEAASTDGTGQSAPGRENEKGVEKKEKDSQGAREGAQEGRKGRQVQGEEGRGCSGRARCCKRGRLQEGKEEGQRGGAAARVRRGDTQGREEAPEES